MYAWRADTPLTVRNAAVFSSPSFRTVTVVVCLSVEACGWVLTRLCTAVIDLKILVFYKNALRIKGFAYLALITTESNGAYALETINLINTFTAVATRRRSTVINVNSAMSTCEPRGTGTMIVWYEIDACSAVQALADTVVDVHFAILPSPAFLAGALKIARQILTRDPVNARWCCTFVDICNERWQLVGVAGQQGTGLIPNWQAYPSHSFEQMHLNLSTRSTHVPPLWHGEDWHSSISVINHRVSIVMLKWLKNLVWKIPADLKNETTARTKTCPCLVGT